MHKGWVSSLVIWFHHVHGIKFHSADTQTRETKINMTVPRDFLKISWTENQNEQTCVRYSPNMPLNPSVSSVKSSSIHTCKIFTLLYLSRSQYGCKTLLCIFWIDWVWISPQKSLLSVSSIVPIFHNGAQVCSHNIVLKHAKYLHSISINLAQDLGNNFIPNCLLIQCPVYCRKYFRNKMSKRTVNHRHKLQLKRILGTKLRIGSCASILSTVHMHFEPRSSWFFVYIEHVLPSWGQWGS